MSFHRSNDFEHVGNEVRATRERVGVTEIEKIVRIRQNGEEQLFSARLQCFVDLGAQQKGAHMSRFEEVVNEVIGEVVLGAQTATDEVEEANRQNSLTELDDPDLPGLILAGARVSYAMARDGLLFERVGRLNGHRVPSTALMIQGVWAAALTLPLLLPRAMLSWADTASALIRPLSLAVRATPRSSRDSEPSRTTSTRSRWRR